MSSASIGYAFFGGLLVYGASVIAGLIASTKPRRAQVLCCNFALLWRTVTAVCGDSQPAITNQNDSIRPSRQCPGHFSGFSSGVPVPEEPRNRFLSIRERDIPAVCPISPILGLISLDQDL